MTVGVQTATGRLQPAQARRPARAARGAGGGPRRLDPERAEEVVAVLDLLISATCWHRLRTLAGLAGGRGPRAAADAARAVVDRVTSRPRKEQP